MIQKQLRTTAPTIIRWKARFLESGMDGLDTHHPGQGASVLTPALQAKILSANRVFAVRKLVCASVLTASHENCSGR